MRALPDPVDAQGANMMHYKCVGIWVIDGNVPSSGTETKS